MTVTALDGNTFLVADDDGNVGTGNEGLFHDDVRHLSRWRLTIDDAPPRLLSNGSTAHYAVSCFGRVGTGGERGAADVVTRRSLSVTTASLQERLELTNNGREPVSVLVHYQFDCDFLDLFEVKSFEFGRRDLVFARSVTPLRATRAYDRAENVYAFSATADGFEVATLLWFSERGIPGEREAFFEVSLAPHGTWSLEANLVLLANGDARRPTYTAEFFGAERRRVEKSVATWHARAPVLQANLPALEDAYEQTLADLGALRMDRPDAVAASLPAAGLPWFMTIFGRDTIIVCLQTMMLGQDLARAALRTLAALQADEDRPEQDAEPGKIIHEMRYGKVAALTSSFPYYGSVDATPLFLMLLGETYGWTGDADLARELEPSARRALAWLEGAADLDGDGYVEFRRRSERGIEIQTWKDSWNSQLFADGRQAETPIAAAEVQGYAYAARLAVARLARVCWGDEALAGRLERDAARLKERFNRDFWVETRGGGHFALALDGAKRPVDSLTSNVGHLLWTGIVADDRLAPTARVLLEPELFSGWGVRTMAKSSGGYNPIEYHNGTVWPHDTSIACAGLARTGHAPEAARLFLALLEAAEHFGWRLPEVIAGFDRDETGFPVLYPTSCSPQAWASGAPILCLQAVLGLEPDPVTETLTAAAEVPVDGLDLHVDGVEAFGRPWTVAVEDSVPRVEGPGRSEPDRS